MAGKEDSKSLYEVLGISKEASQDEVKKAYRRLALQLHPDKNPGEDAKEKFQTVQKVYDVLRDPEKRKMYDETGIWDGADEEDLSSAFDYVRTAPITEEDILEFEANYRGSEKEKSELLEFYTRFKGNMRMVFEYLVCSREDMDSHRFMDTIEEAIAAGEVKSYKNFKTWAKEIKTKPRPSNPLKPAKKRKKSADTTMDLVAQIKQSRSNFLAKIHNLGERYGVPDDEMPTEEEFQATQQRMKEAAAAKKTKKTKKSKKA